MVLIPLSPRRKPAPAQCLPTDRMIARTTATLALVAGLAACNPPPADEAPPAPAATDEAPLEVDEPSLAPPPGTPAAAADDHDDCEHDPTWHAWAEAQQLAAERQAPMLLYVYADWCPRCRELAPVLDECAVREPADGVVFVRHNQDVEAPWLRDLVGDHDTYVPRVMFLDADGHRMDLVSPHPRYPFFYTPSMRDALLANIGQALARGG